MVRPLRIEFAGALYHVTARGNAREDIYRDDVDRQQFLMLLRNTVNQMGCITMAQTVRGNLFFYAAVLGDLAQRRLHPAPI